MRVAEVTRFGPPEVLVTRDRPDPLPGPREVVIDVAAADTLWVETLIRSGAGQDVWPMRPPYVPGGAVAGHISVLGDGVDPGLSGRAVVAHVRTRGHAEGGYAEKVVVPVDAPVDVPDGLPLTAAAALLHDGPTALALFGLTAIGASDTVLVIGASGGLGIVSLQLARVRAKRVVATARGVAKLDRVRLLGPDAVVDTEAPDWVARARDALGGGADVVLDNIGGEIGEAAFPLLEPGGRFSAHGTPSGRFARIDPREAERRGVRLFGIGDVQLPDDQRRRYTAEALAEAGAGTLAPVVGQSFPLDQAAAAHAAIEARTVFGTTLLLPCRTPGPA
jgi:NADPH2:quinone reductase